MIYSNSTATHNTLFHYYVKGKASRRNPKESENPFAFTAVQTEGTMVQNPLTLRGKSKISQAFGTEKYRP